MSKENDKKIFAFDVDGTIMSSKGKLVNDIVPFVLRMMRAYPNAQFSLITSGTVSAAKYAAKKLGEAYHKTTNEGFCWADKQVPAFSLDIVALGGSYVTKGTQSSADSPMEFSEHPTTRNPLTAEEIAEVTNVLQAEEFKGTDILYYGEEDMVYTKSKIGKKRLITGILKTAKNMKSGVLPNAEKKEYSGISAVSPEELKKRMAQDIFTLGLVNLSREKNKAIALELGKRFKDRGLKVTAGTLLEVGHSNKMQALKSLYGENAKKVIYFGDGTNDIPCLTNADLSFAIGKKLKVLQSGKYAIESFIDAIDICLTGKSSKELEEKSAALIKAAEEKSDNIKSKIKAALKSNSKKDAGMEMK